MEDKNKVQIGLFVGIAAIAFIGLVYAIATAYYGSGPASEAGLSSVCWNASGVATYDVSTCTDPQELRWSRDSMPLSVRTTNGARESALQGAIDLINTQVGCQILVLDSGRQPETDGFDVLVSFDVPMTSGQDHPGGSTQIRRDALSRQRVYIDVYASALNADMLHKVLVHELGHGLGLAHDDWEGSIMRPVQLQEVEFVRLSDADQRLLAELYCAQ